MQVPAAAGIQTEVPVNRHSIGFQSIPLAALLILFLLSGPAIAGENLPQAAEPAAFHALSDFPANKDELLRYSNYRQLLCEGYGIGLKHGKALPGGNDAPPPSCSGTEIFFGTGNVEGVTGNGSMAAGFAPEGELTVLKWPSPSYHDQVSYLTPYLPFRDTGELRNSKANGAAVNAGSFAGLYCRTGDDGFMSWFRDRDGENSRFEGDPADDWVHTSYYDDPSGVILTVESENTSLGLSVEARNFVVPNDPSPFERNTTRNSVLVRHYTITLAPDSPLQSASFVYYENLEPCTWKLPGLPLVDHLFDFANDCSAVYKRWRHAVLHYRPGDPANGIFDGVYMAVGGDFGRPDGWQVGLQNQEEESWLLPQCAYFDASDGELSGCSRAFGIPPRYSAGLMKELEIEPGGTVEATIFITAAFSAGEALTLLDDSRREGVGNLRTRTDEWWRELMAGCSLPRPGFPDPAVNEKIVHVAERAILNIFVGLDKITNAVVASVNTQSPYGEDWPRDGAFFNHALDVAGFYDITTNRLVDYYSSIARSKGQAIWFWPGMAFPVDLAGTYEMNYYSDGVVGGPIFFEIDNAGLIAWSMWDHYEFLRKGTEAGCPAASDYLAAVYPSLARTVQTLALCRDADNGLQCTAFEDDNYIPTQTLHGAVTTHLALECGIEASEEMERLGLPGVSQQWLSRWRWRLEELGEAVRSRLFDGEQGIYPGGGAAAWLVWPACMITEDDPEFDTHCRYLLDQIAPALHLDTDCASYQAKHTCALARAGWFGEASGYSGFTVEEAQTVLMTEVPTTGTNQYGEVYVCVDYDGDGVRDTFDNRTTVPHIWEGALQYIAAMTLWPPGRGE